MVEETHLPLRRRCVEALFQPAQLRAIKIGGIEREEEGGTIGDLTLNVSDIED
jgi:hypothetical protein